MKKVKVTAPAGKLVSPKAAGGQSVPQGTGREHTGAGKLMLMDAAKLEARYKEPYPKDCMEQDRGEQRFQTFNPD